jgi:preprotein translocase subunit SecY
MGGMLETLRNAWKIADLKKKIIFTAVMLLIYRLGGHIPVPGFDSEQFKKLFESNSLQLAGFLDIVSGGAFKNATIFAMSITPYINASIIMQLLTVAIPKLEQMQKEGEEGRKKIAKFVRYGTVILGFIQAVGLFVSLRSAVKEVNVMSFLTITLTFTAGTAFLMWLGEQINEYGIGNGISLIIFAGIVSRAPSGAYGIWQMYQAGTLGGGVIGFFAIMIIIVVFLALVTGVVWVQQAERRIPVQYAKRVVGRKMYGGQSTHIPIKVNSAGVIPIIFAMSIMMFPGTIVQMFAGPNPKNWFLRLFLQTGSWYYTVIYAFLIVGFTFFYTVMVFNPIEISNNMKKNGGFIPGIRPGKPTSEYIYKVLMRITWFNAAFLAFITVFPNIIAVFWKVNNIWFAGTGLLILVGVALDTVKQIESQMLMRHYKGFLE